VRATLPDRGRQHVGDVTRAVVAQIRFAGVLAKRPSEQGIRDASRQLQRAGGVIGRDAIAQDGERYRPRKGVKALDRLQRLDRILQRQAAGLASRPILRMDADTPPQVCPRGVHQHELVNTIDRFRGHGPSSPNCPALIKAGARSVRALGTAGFKSRA
jgi:hypothetical protein